MPTSTRVLILVDEEWWRVGTAAIETHPRTGMRMLCLHLQALAPKLYVSLGDIRVLEEGAPADLPVDGLGPLSTEVGHA